MNTVVGCPCCEDTPSVRERKVTQFYASIRKRPADVFPLQFAMDRGLATGLVSGKLGGLFRFPMWEKTFEMTTREGMIQQGIQVTEVKYSGHIARVPENTPSGGLS